MTKKEVSKAEVALNEAVVKNVIPKNYPHIISEFSEVKNNLDSGNYDLIHGSEILAKDLIDSINEVKDKILEIQKQETIEKQKQQLLQEERKKNGLCMMSGAKLSFFDKLRGRTSCTKH